MPGALRRHLLSDGRCSAGAQACELLGDDRIHWSRVEPCWLGCVACSSPCSHPTSCLGAMVVSARSRYVMPKDWVVKGNLHGACPLCHLL